MLINYSGATLDTPAIDTVVLACLADCLEPESLHAVLRFAIFFRNEEVRSLTDVLARRAGGLEQLTEAIFQTNADEPEGAHGEYEEMLREFLHDVPAASPKCESGKQLLFAADQLGFFQHSAKCEGCQVARSYLPWFEVWFELRELICHSRLRAGELTIKLDYGDKDGLAPLKALALMSGESKPPIRFKEPVGDVILL